MKINSNMFLYSYAFYLVSGLILVLVGYDANIISKMILAISIVSGCISIGELFYTRGTIDKEERIKLMQIYATINKQCKKYEDKIFEKYEDEAEKIVTLVYSIFDENDCKLIYEEPEKIDENKRNELFRIVEDKVTDPKEREKVCSHILSFIDTSNEIYLETDNEVDKLFTEAQRKEGKNIYIAKIIVIGGLFIFLFILTINFNECKVNQLLGNIFTILGFLAVIVNLLLKDNYKKKAIQQLDINKKKLFEEIRGDIEDGEIE